MGRKIILFVFRIFWTSSPLIWCFSGAAVGGQPNRIDEGSPFNWTIVVSSTTKFFPEKIDSYENQEINKILLGKQEFSTQVPLRCYFKFDTNTRTYDIAKDKRKKSRSYSEHIKLICYVDDVMFEATPVGCDMTLGSGSPLLDTLFNSNSYTFSNGKNGKGINIAISCNAKDTAAK